jgi:hypothetical protein
MSSKENLQLFLSPRLTSRSARAAQEEDKLSDLQVLGNPDMFAFKSIDDTISFSELHN